MSYKIYKITNNEGDFYIGSTKQELSKRFKQHQSSFLRFLLDKAPYYSAVEVLKGTNIEIECLEDLGNISSQEAKLKENEYISKFLDCVNKYRSYTTEEEKRNYIKQYYTDNKDKFKQYYTDNKDKFKKYYNDNKYKFKQWYL
jgi:hypothetical protein